MSLSIPTLAPITILDHVTVNEYPFSTLLGKRGPSSQEKILCVVHIQQHNMYITLMHTRCAFSYKGSGCF